MLYDNALLASRVPARRAPLRRRRATAGSPTETLDYLQRELALDGGGFASAQDADTDGVEGLTFSWAPGEGAPEELLRAVRARPLRAARRARRRRARAAARDARAAAQPLRDDKAIASWNGLALAALAQAGRVDAGGARSRSSCSARSRRRTGASTARWRDGVAKGTGYLEDYADVAYGLMELHVASGDPRWLREAHRLAHARRRALRRRRAAAASSRRRSTASSSSRARRSSTTTRRRAGTRCSPMCCCASRRIWGDDELERRAVSVLRLVRAALMRAAVVVRVDARRARPAPGTAPRARDRRLARRTRRAARARRGGGDGRDRVRPGRRRAAARRAHRGRRPAGRLPLRALRVRATRDRSGSSFGLPHDRRRPAPRRPVDGLAALGGQRLVGCGAVERPPVRRPRVRRGIGSSAAPSV